MPSHWWRRSLSSCPTPHPLLPPPPPPLHPPSLALPGAHSSPQHAPLHANPASSPTQVAISFGLRTTVSLYSCLHKVHSSCTPWARPPPCTNAHLCPHSSDISILSHYPTTAQSGGHWDGESLRLGAFVSQHPLVGFLAGKKGWLAIR